MNQKPIAAAWKGPLMHDAAWKGNVLGPELRSRALARKLQYAGVPPSAALFGGMPHPRLGPVPAPF